MTTRLSIALSFLILILTAPPAPAVTSQEVSKAKAERVALQRELDRAVAAYDAAQAKLARTQDSIESNEKALAQASARAKVVQSRLTARANIIYRRGPAGMLQFLFTAQSIGDFTRRVKLIGEVADRDAVDLAAANKIKRETAGLKDELDEKKRQEDRLLATMSDQTRSLTSNFQRAQVLETKLSSERETQIRQQAERAARAAREAEAKEAEARKAAAAKASPKPSPSPVGPKASPQPSQIRTDPKAEEGATAAATGGMACPVDGPTSFTDTWGAPRGGGRVHQGVDMFAAQGTPVAAITGGVVIRRENSAAGGLGLRMRGTDSTEYYYAHLSGYTKYSAGQKVSAGDQIGYVGSTGNASGGPPHLHFEVHPRGGPPVNPTPTARKACGK